MNMDEFEAALARDGFKEIMTRTLEPRPANEAHTHPFTARGLITAGEFVITIDGVARSYRAGETFEVAAGTRHDEAVGPEGVTLTTGRRF
jgi:quercetin dioxygenase-like cupin family protein